MSILRSVQEYHATLKFLYRLGMKLSTGVRIYQAGVYSLGDTIELSAEASHHLGGVLRKQIGDCCILFCGDNREFSAIISSMHKRKIFVTIQSVQAHNIESPCQIHLAQAISKGERMEWVVQKAVELGVASISPLITKRCVVRASMERFEKKQKQWEAIAIAACEQSGRNVVPTIHPISPLDFYLQQSHARLKLVLYPGAAKSWRDYSLNLSKDIALLIGPEGGLSDEEIATAQKAQFQALSLGPRILRTETATITALSVLQATAGDV